jgi:hypothetical protein
MKRFRTAQPTYLIAAVAAVLLAAALIGCAGYRPAAENGILEIENATEKRTIFFLYTRSSSEQRWEDDLLEDAVIEPGEVRQLQIAPGTYDVQAADFFNLEIATFYEQTIASGETTRLRFR